MEKEKMGFWKMVGDAVRGKEQDYTSGNIKEALILLSIPMILEMLMESLFAIVDIFFVSKISNNAIATIGMTESVLMLIESVAIGIAMGATALIARRVGEKNFDLAKVSAIQAILLGLSVSVVTGILAFYFAGDILALMGGDEALIEEGKGYTRIVLSMNFILMLLFIFNGIFRAAGNPAVAMRTLWISNGLNIILDPIFIFGIGPITGMGVTGAAVATCIGRGVGVLYQMNVFGKGSSLIKIEWQDIKVNWNIFKKLVNVSIGGTGQFLISTASWLFIVRILASFGSAVLAGYTISLRIIIFCILPAWGMANATATLVGQNLGANQPERAETTVWKAAKYNAIYLFVLSVIFFLGSDFIISFFTKDPEVIKAANACLKILCLGYIFFAYQMVMMQSYNGAGDTKTPTVLNFIFFWLLQIPLAYLVSIHFEFGPNGVYGSIVFAEVLLAITTIILFRKGNWKNIEV